jgi:hypothetical protein
MHQAAGAVKERRGASRPVKNQMSYFFACLEDTLGHTTHATSPPPD